MYHNIFLKKSFLRFLLYKIYVKIKILLSRNLIVVIVDKADYLNKMENLLNDTWKFEKINLKNDGISNFAVNQEKRVDNILKNLLCLMAYLKEQGDLLHQLGPGIMQRLCKVQKDIIDNCPPFRPILSAINTPTYKLAKFLVPILKSLTSNEYTVKDSFAFAEEIVEQDSEFFMGSLDVDSIFANIHLKKLLRSALIHFLKIQKK